MHVIYIVYIYSKCRIYIYDIHSAYIQCICICCQYAVYVYCIYMLRIYIAYIYCVYTVYIQYSVHPVLSVHTDRYMHIVYSYCLCIIAIYAVYMFCICILYIYILLTSAPRFITWTGRYIVPLPPSFWTPLREIGVQGTKRPPPYIILHKNIFSAHKSIFGRFLHSASFLHCFAADNSHTSCRTKYSVTDL